MYYCDWGEKDQLIPEGNMGGRVKGIANVATATRPLCYVSGRGVGYACNMVFLLRSWKTLKRIYVMALLLHRFASRYKPHL